MVFGLTDAGKRRKYNDTGDRSMLIIYFLPLYGQLNGFDDPNANDVYLRNA